ncbi:MAG: hypothetical protein ABEJ07_06660 [Candidatus Nanohaloarchaea archaeon]
MREKLVSARMNALWFTYIALFLFSLMPNWDIYLNFVQIFGISTGFTVLLNIWNWHRDDGIFDERKKKVATNGMAWAFVVVTLLMIPMGTTGVEIDAKLVRETALMGLWSWMTYFSLENLYHRYGDDLW